MISYNHTLYIYTHIIHISYYTTIIPYIYNHI
nr:MAG TPA: hypothetical protein [Caudoviricetes sp.]